MLTTAVMMMVAMLAMLAFAETTGVVGAGDGAGGDGAHDAAVQNGEGMAELLMRQEAETRGVADEARVARRGSGVDGGSFMMSPPPTASNTAGNDEEQE